MIVKVAAVATISLGLSWNPAPASAQILPVICGTPMAIGFICAPLALDILAYALYVKITEPDCPYGAHSSLFDFAGRGTSEANQTINKSEANLSCLKCQMDSNYSKGLSGYSGICAPSGSTDWSFAGQCAPFFDTHTNLATCAQEMYQCLSQGVLASCCNGTGLGCVQQ